VATASAQTEVESGLVSHDAVAEAAVIAVPDDIRGNVIHAYCILVAGVEGDKALEEELKNHVGEEVGPIAKPSVINFVDKLPKTRSGKIMRRILKAQAQGLPIGDTSTLED
jgi:acetyl-CoA synthetase